MTTPDGPVNREGAWAQQAEAELPDRRQREEIDRALSHGLAAAPTINDRRISTFVRGELPHFAGEVVRPDQPGHVARREARCDAGGAGR
jgi:agmatinase